jgi:TetR/AcrR family transcriptional regulator, mexJK operon transcriptional repressor
MTSRGRPNKRDTILQAARKQFLAHGFAATSVDAIVLEAGVSKPTVYAHFPTKEALLDAVVTAESDGAELPVSFRITENPQVDLEQTAHLILTLAMAPESLAWDRMMAGEARMNARLGRIFYDRGPGQLLKALSEFFKSIDRSGALSIQNPAQAADFFFSLVVGVPLLSAQLTGQIMTRNEIAVRASSAAELFWNAYSTKKAPRSRTRTHRGD